MVSVEHIAALGMTGTGKTYWIKQNIILPAINNKIPIVLFDLENDYNDLGFYDLNNFYNIEQIIQTINVPIRIDTEFYDIEEMQSEIYEYLFQNIRNCIIIVDEVHEQGGKQSSLDTNLKRLITQGRKRGLKMVIASQRPALTDKTLLSNCGKIVFKKCNWKTDWDVYKSINKEVHDRLKISKNKYETVIMQMGNIL